ncbi:MAG: cupin [Desulfobacteraceae bacterium]|nr:cupin [Desulfobacteraceae bacterium]
MKRLNLADSREFSPIAIRSLVLHDSPYFKIINFNLGAGQLFPVHSHQIEGQLSMLVLEGEGEFLSDTASQPARAGDLLISEISEPHGVRAKTEMRLLVTIAPPI